MKVGNYEFALKSIKHFAAGSQETECFTADLYVNGKTLAVCRNQGHGGSTFVDFYPAMVKQGREIEEFLKTQPKIKPEGHKFELELNLEYIVDNLLEKHLTTKFLEKIKKKTVKSLVFKVSEYRYSYTSWGKATIEEMLKDPQDRMRVQKAIATETAKGHILINENIPADLLPAQK